MTTIQNQITTAMTGVEKINDGRRAFCPHPFFQNCMFALCSRLLQKDPDTGRFKFSSSNSKGDTLTVESFQRIRNDDMGLFLAVLALYQHSAAWFPEEDREIFREKAVTKEVLRGIYSDVIIGDTSSAFTSDELYRITGKNWRALRTLQDRLWLLGSIRIRIDFANPAEHQGRNAWGRNGLWSYGYDGYVGKPGLWQMSVVNDLIPRDTYLWADAALCNRLKSDTARNIFWRMIEPQHKNIEGVSALKTFCGTAAAATSDKYFFRDQFGPAVKELESYGYSIEDSGVGERKVWKFKRPLKLMRW